MRGRNWCPSPWTLCRTKSGVVIHIFHGSTAGSCKQAETIHHCHYRDAYDKNLPEPATVDTVAADSTDSTLWFERRNALKGLDVPQVVVCSNFFVGAITVYWFALWGLMRKPDGLIGCGSTLLLGSPLAAQIPFVDEISWKSLCCGHRFPETSNHVNSNSTNHLLPASITAILGNLLVTITIGTALEYRRVRVFHRRPAATSMLNFPSFVTIENGRSTSGNPWEASCTVLIRGPRLMLFL